MNRHVTVSLITALAIAGSTGVFISQNVSADQVEEKENPQQSQQKIEKETAEFGKKIDSLELKIKTAKDEAKEDLSRQIRDLRKKQEDVHILLKRMKVSSGDAWKDAKSGAQAAINDLRKAYEKARRRF